MLLAEIVASLIVIVYFSQRTELCHPASFLSSFDIFQDFCTRSNKVSGLVVESNGWKIRPTPANDTKWMRSAVEALNLVNIVEEGARYTAVEC